MRTLLIIAAVILSPTLAFSQTLIASCGGLTGHAYYLEGGLLNMDQGWTSDGMSDGSTRLLRLRDGSYNLISKDAASERSYNDEGIVVLPVKADIQKGEYLIMAAGNTFLETYTFKLNKNGSGKLLFTQSKLDITNSSRLMVGNCAALR